jgi:hypothetical protein
VRDNRLPEDARRILGAYQRAELVRMQATVLRETALVTDAPAPIRGPETKIGDPAKLRGFPVVGVPGGFGGATGGSIPHVDGLSDR